MEKSPYEILKKDINERNKKEKEKKKKDEKVLNLAPQTLKKEKKDDTPKLVSKNIGISFTFNPKTNLYTFIYAINNSAESFTSQSIEEAMEHITAVIKENALKKETRTPTTQIENESKDKKANPKNEKIQHLSLF